MRNKGMFFDKHGYPTDETLETIEQWDFQKRHACFDYIVAAWQTDYGSVTDRLVRRGGKQVRVVKFVTGGWSGNESLIGALRQNHVIQSLTWELDRIGGLHVYVLEVK